MSHSETRALSIRQPWAWAIVYGGKPAENRGHGGRILIHAGKTFDQDGYEWICDNADDLGLRLGSGLMWDESLPLVPSASEFLRGGIIGAATLAACIDEPQDVGDELADQLDDPFRQRVEAWFFGPFGFVLTNPEPLRFRRCRGMLGLFQPEVQL